MRILTVSDKVEPVLYGPHIRDRVGHVDLVLACGDLPYYYLEYVVGLLDAPLFYVHGNHDQVIARTMSGIPAAGSTISWGTDLHVRPVEHRGLLLAGLEGCRRYSPKRPFQYTEAEMRWQAMQLGLKLWANRLRYGRFVDILITHAPPRGIHDDEDVPHQGFESYLAFMRAHRPRLLIHGHQHVYNRNAATMETQFEDTLVVNTYGYRVIELEQKGSGWRIASTAVA